MKKIIIFIVSSLISIVSILIVNNFLVLELFTRRYVYFQIVVGLLVFSILLWQKDGYTRTNTAATVVTVIGVFGTFLGIYRGLQVFDIQNIEESIPHLLEGLKLSFLTSLIGIGYALILKFITLFPTTADMSSKVIDIQTSGDVNLLAQLVTLNTTIEKEGSETRTALGSIKEGLTGIHTSLADGQNETVAQLQGLTTTVSERHDSLNKTVAEKHDNLINLQMEEGNQTREKLTNLQAAFTDGQSALRTQLENLAITFSTKHDLLIDEFQVFSRNVAESVAKLATDELIEALKTVIEEFNAKISEQFGENFKQLNEAVEKTVAWQEQYRQQMDELADEFRIAAESIEKSRESVVLIAESSNTIAGRSESIVACTEKLDPILHTLNDQLDAFSSLRQRAHEAFPLIESRLDKLTTDFSSAVQTAIRESHDNVESQRDALLEQSVLLETTVKSTTENIDQLATNFSKSVNTSIEQSHDSMNQQREALTQRFSELESATAAANQQLQESINSIGSELDTVFEESRNQIAKLMTGFTKDLTQQLKSTLDQITTDFSDTVKITIADSHRSMENQRDALTTHSNDLQTTIEQVTQGVDDIMQKVSETVNTSQTAMNQQKRELLDLAEQLGIRFNNLEDTLESELTKALNSFATAHRDSLQRLGGQLAALSDKFVDDYTPLTEELQKLVNIASNNQGNRGRDIPF